jgi:hypothetical protein
MHRIDPFPCCSSSCSQFHAGLEISYLAAANRGHLDPVTMVQALERGAATRIDLADHWDFWAVVDRPVDELRELYGIAPLA